MQKELLVAITTGLLALIGGFFGSWLARRTDYERWLRQERGEAFSQFLQHLHNAWVFSVETLNDSSLSDSLADLRITEKFVALESQQNIVRLYLFKGDRETFTELIRSLWATQTRAITQGDRMEKTRQIVKAIQFILENRLHG